MDPVSSSAASLSTQALTTAFTQALAQSNSTITVRELAVMAVIAIAGLVYVAKEIIPLFRKGDYNRPVLKNDLPPTKRMYEALETFGRIERKVDNANEIILQKDVDGQHSLLTIPVWLRKLILLGEEDARRSERLEKHIASLVNHQMDVLKDIAEIIRSDRKDFSGTMARLDSHLEKMESHQFPPSS